MTTAAPPPSIQEVLALPAVIVETAPPEWEDVNGHVNVARYYDLHLRGAEAALTALGVDDASAALRSLETRQVVGKVLLRP